MSNVCNNVFLGRYKFYNARKRNTQSYIDWALYILGLSKECRFKTNLNVTLRDRFITGLLEGPTLNRLLQEDVYKLKFVGAVEIASECDMEVNKRKLQKYQTNDDLDGRSGTVSATSTEISDMIENQLPVHQRTVIKERKPKFQQTTLTGIIAKTKAKAIEDINLNKKGCKSCESTAVESKPIKKNSNMDRKRSENDSDTRNDFDGLSSSSQGRRSSGGWHDWNRSRSPEPISPNKRDRTCSNSPNHNKDAKRRKIDYNSPNISRQSSPCHSRNRWQDSQNRSNSRYQKFEYNRTSTNSTGESNSHKVEHISKFKQVEEIEVDLFKMPVEYSLGHCVAEDMKMGKGIAVGFRKTFKRVDELLKQGAEKGGLAVLNDKGRFIYYLVTKTMSYGKPTYGTMWNSLQRMKEHIVRNNVKNLALPRLGCGLDKLEWNIVKNMLEDTFSNIDIKIIVCNFQKKSKQTYQTKKEQYQRHRGNRGRRFNY